MNTKSLKSAIQSYYDVKRLGYATEILRPFILAYLAHPGLQKKYNQFRLFNHYMFRTDIMCPELYPSHRSSKSISEQNIVNSLLRKTEMFVGFRNYNRRFVPFFVSLDSVKDYTLKNGFYITPCFFITGFSTFTEERQNDNEYFNPKYSLNLSEYKSTKTILKNWSIIKQQPPFDDTGKEIYKIAKKSSYFKK